MTLWDKKAAVYDAVRKWPGIAAIHEKEQDHLRRLLDGISAEWHLDLGCGTGSWLNSAPSSDRRILADASLSMLRRARAAADGWALQLDAGLRLPFRDDRFDLVTAIGLLEYLKDPAAFFKEALRIVRPGAYLLFTVAPPGILTRLRALNGAPARSLSSEKTTSLLRQTGWQAQPPLRTLMQTQWRARRPG